MSKVTRRAFLSLGSNLGDRCLFLRRAREALAAIPETAVLAASRIYETAPQDFEDQPPFLNQVVCVQTGLPPAELLAAAQSIEDAQRRVRGVRFGPRTLDIDILLFEDVELEEPDLMLPHPRMLSRAFVLVPLTEVWDFARGMPGYDVASLAQVTALEQQVRPCDAAEASG